ncbi:MAG: hypothetical protein AAGL98_00145 [Planctomycetota bacterium]
MSSHLNALQLRLSNERVRLTNAKTGQERAMRAVWVAQIEKEIASETSHTFSDTVAETMTDDELLAALEG